VIDVVEIWAGIDSDVAAETEKTAVSIIWGRHNFLTRDVALAVSTASSRSVWMGGFVVYVGCFKPLTDCFLPRQQLTTLYSRD
jgi:hypothetical protein